MAIDNPLEDPLTITILEPLAKELALPLSKLVKEVSSEARDKKEAESLIRATINALEDHGLVKVRRVDKSGDEGVISITADGIRILEMVSRDATRFRPPARPRPPRL